MIMRTISEKSMQNKLPNGGVYLVDSIPFINKSEALLFGSKQGKEVSWNFHDEVYSQYNWQTPVDESLDYLYKARAQQLRDKYDYVSLNFSGGVDCTNILHAFIDNDIFLDEIVMHVPENLMPKANKDDKSANNLHSEIVFAAIPHLKKYLTNSKTLVRLLHMNEATDSFVNSSKLSYEFNAINFLLPNQFARRALYLKDKVWLALYEQGKSVGHIWGVDKPIINYRDNVCFFQFTDWCRTTVFESTESSDAGDMIKKYQNHEYFYWTPDMPKLVIKQCQVVRKLCDTDYIFKLLFTNSHMYKSDKFIGIVNYLYPAHVNSVRNYFATSKPILGYSANVNSWFDSSVSSNSLGFYKELTKYIKDNIDIKYLTADKSELAIFRSKEYVL